MIGMSPKRSPALSARQTRKRSSARHLSSARSRCVTVATNMLVVTSRQVRLYVSSAKARPWLLLSDRYARDDRQPLGRRELRFVLAWAELHQDELFENWQLARAGETLNEIEPLR